MERDNSSDMTNGCARRPEKINEEKLNAEEPVAALFDVAGVIIVINAGLAELKKTLIYQIDCTAPSEIYIYFIRDRK